jgi:hypothetical protein
MMFSFVDYWGALDSDVTKDFTLYPGTNIVKSRYAGRSMASTAPTTPRARPTASSMA